MIKGKLRLFSRWRKHSKAKTFQLAVWAAEHPVEIASAAALAGVLLGAAALYVKQRRRKK
jgi:hypothetical protein